MTGPNKSQRMWRFGCVEIRNSCISDSARRRKRGNLSHWKECYEPAACSLQPGSGAAATRMPCGVSLTYRLYVR